MKTTGMVRRVDGLGRIVIPKEIRKVLKMKENEQVEISVEDDKIVLSRYSELDEYDQSIQNLIDRIKKVYEKDILLTNLNNFVLGTNDYKNLMGNELSSYLNKILEERKEVYEDIPTVLSLSEGINNIKKSYIIKPIIKNGDNIGLLILLSNNTLENNDLKVYDLMNSFLDKYLE